MNDSDETPRQLQEIREGLGTVKTLLTRAEDRSLGYFLSAFGLSLMGISIGVANMSSPVLDEDTTNKVFIFGMAFVTTGLLLAFTRFFSFDPRGETLFWLDRHRPFIHLRMRKNRPVDFSDSDSHLHEEGLSEDAPPPPTTHLTRSGKGRKREDKSALFVVMILMITFLVIYYASKWQNTLTSGDLLIAIATIFLAYATVLLGQHSSELTNATERLRELEQKRERRLRLQRLLQESDRAITLETASIAVSIGKGIVPQPHFDIAKSIAEYLGPEDNPMVVSIVLDIVGALRADLRKPAERISRAASTQDLFESLQKELRHAMYAWQGELIGL